MGCAPSSHNLQVNDNETRLLQEIDRLRTGHQSQQQEISRLHQENEKLRQGQLNGGYQSTSDGIDTGIYEEDGSHNLLVKEIEKLRLEQQEKDREIEELRQNNEDLNVKLLESPQVAQVQYTAELLNLICIG